MSGVMQPQQRPGALDDAGRYWQMYQTVKGMSGDDKKDAMERRKSKVMNPNDQQKSGGMMGLGG